MVGSSHGNHRIHDCRKGFGTVSKDGKSILWDWWRPPTKRQREKRERAYQKWVAKGCPMVIPAWLVDAIKAGPRLADIFAVQPMQEASNAPAFPMDYVYSTSGSKNNS
jgi:hypothetical protein